jgi:hypothetical protein
MFDLVLAVALEASATPITPVSIKIRVEFASGIFKIIGSRTHAVQMTIVHRAMCNCDDEVGWMRGGTARMIRGDVRRFGH